MTPFSRPFCVALVLIGLSGCLNRVGVDDFEASGPIEQPTTFTSADLTAVLSAHVDDAGLVDYAGLVADPQPLDAYLTRLATTDPSKLGDDDRLAFWINAYNAYTVYLIRDQYPTKGILKTVSGPFIPTVNSPFSDAFAVVGGRTMSLDDIEHGTIRSEFDEPRIHFAVNCAALSCPPLRAEAYEGATLDAQLGQQARRFLTDPARTQIDVAAGTARITKIMDWFKGDFGGSDDAVQRWIAPYIDDAEARSALESASLDVKYMSYDWSLNDQAR